MDLPKIGSFDPRSFQGLDSLRSINLEDIKDFIKNKKMELLAGGIFLIALISVALISNSTRSSLKTLETKKSALQEKAEPIKKYKEVMKHQEAFLNSLPPALGDNNFITALTDIAKKNGVRITDFTPPIVQEDRYYRKLTSKFACAAPAFSNAILFINDLEQSAYAIKLDNWALHLQQAKTKGGVLGNVDSNPASTYIMDLTISSIKIEPDSKADVKPAAKSKSTKNEH